MRVALIFLAAAACHHGHVGPPAPTTGAIAGLIRDRDSGQALPKAALAIQKDGELDPLLIDAGPDGAYEAPRLPPGRYDVTASYAGVTVDVRGVTVTAGHTAAVDLDLRLGQPVVEHVDYGDPHEGDVRTYRAPGADPTTGALEGTVADAATRERVPGAVVTATSPALRDAVQVITDDRGRYTIAPLAPGTYSVSAYYTVAHHATIQVERNQIPVHGGETAVVPLFVETQQ